MSWGLGDFIRQPGGVANGGPDVAQHDAAQIEDWLTAGEGPLHPRLFEALREQRFAARFGHAAADR